jgi:hypothetical protein
MKSNWQSFSRASCGWTKELHPEEETRERRARFKGMLRRSPNFAGAWRRSEEAVAVRATQPE